MSLPHSHGFKLLEKALEKNVEKMAWEQWLVAYSKMDKDSFISFSDYLKKLKEPKVTDNRTEEEILEDVEGILKMKVKHS